MTTLSSSERSRLEKTVLDARAAAERGVRKRFDALDLVGGTAPAGLSAEDRTLRNALRERARNLGRGRVNPDLVNILAIQAGVPFLVEELAYDTWHRMLFARFLAENDLLVHPEYGVSLTVDDIYELAAEANADSWELAAELAAHRLPGLFHLATPLRLASEDRQDLSRILASLEPSLFHASDALGWVYQYWQSKRKDEVNASGEKITGATLPAVTQLFTEDYMVDFLLQNSLGAWYVSRFPDTALKEDWAYLRYRDDGTPAAGTFETWPETVAEVTVMDPCCGSGHFLVAAFHMLTTMRQEQEGLSAPEAADAVLRDNLFGLELDARCTQIATFAVALEAWKIGGHPEVHVPQVACSGIPVAGQKHGWVKLAKGDANLSFALEQLYEQFSQAAELGSLINPKRAALMAAGGKRGQAGFALAHEWNGIRELLKKALERERASDPASRIFSAEDDALVGTLKAAQLLSHAYTLVATNVPFVGQIKQHEGLRRYADLHFKPGKADLSTTLLLRILDLCYGTISLVLPDGWFFQSRDRDLRRTMLETSSFKFVAKLGVGAFRNNASGTATVSLLSLDVISPSPNGSTWWLDCSDTTSIPQRKVALCESPIEQVFYRDMLTDPKQVIARHSVSASRLGDFADGIRGLSTGATDQFVRKFWEIAQVDNEWEYFLTAVEASECFSGRSHVILWENESGQISILANQLKHLNHAIQSWRRGKPFWGKKGVAVGLVGSLNATLYEGERYSDAIGAIVPKDEKHLLPIWAFLKSDDFVSAVRSANKKLKVEPSYILSVNFDLEHWQQAVEEQYPNGLPEPHSFDPTQWIFDGTVAGSDHPLQVAMARLLGYRWPEESDDGPDALADPDGIVCLPSVYGEPPAEQRLRAVLRTSYGDAWSQDVLAALLKDVGAKSLEEWLRSKTGFFAQHVKLFHNRPFLWQITDGHKEGFSAVVNYHRLTSQGLSKLIYTYLGDWITRQERAVERNEAGAPAKLEAATALRAKLIAIAEGEPPYDVYVRWKSLVEQPIGWDPNLNDGVRLNIRPWIEAGVLQARVNVKWGKDRGKDPVVRDEPLAEEADADLKRRIELHCSVDRHNDLHFTVDEKRRARKLAEEREGQLVR